MAEETPRSHRGRAAVETPEAPATDASGGDSSPKPPGGRAVVDLSGQGRSVSLGGTTGIILTAGGLYIFDRAVIKKQGIDWKAALATGIAVMMFKGLEKVDVKVATALAWLVLVGELVKTDIATDLAGWFAAGFPTGAGSGAISSKDVSGPVTSTGFVGQTTTKNSNGSTTFTNTYNGGTISITKPPLHPVG